MLSSWFCHVTQHVFRLQYQPSLIPFWSVLKKVIFKHKCILQLYGPLWLHYIPVNSSAKEKNMFFCFLIRICFLLCRPPLYSRWTTTCISSSYQTRLWWSCLWDFGERWTKAYAGTQIPQPLSRCYQHLCAPLLMEQVILFSFSKDVFFSSVFLNCSTEHKQSLYQTLNSYFEVLEAYSNARCIQNAWNNGNLPFERFDLFKKKNFFWPEIIS